MYDLNGKFCWIQESGTYSEGLVLTEYKNTHFVEIGGKFVGDESFSRGTFRILLILHKYFSQSCNSLVFLCLFDSLHHNLSEK